MCGLYVLNGPVWSWTELYHYFKQVAFDMPKSKIFKLMANDVAFHLSQLLCPLAENHFVIRKKFKMLKATSNKRILRKWQIFEKFLTNSIVILYYTRNNSFFISKWNAHITCTQITNNMTAKDSLYARETLAILNEKILW